MAAVAPSDEPTRFLFTEMVVAGLPSAPPGTRVRYRDTAVPGFVLRVTDRGIKTFKFRRKINRKVVEVTLGKWPELTVSLARQLARKAQREAVA